MKIIQGNEFIKCTRPALECTIAGNGISDQELSNRPYLVFGDMKIIFEIVFQQDTGHGEETGKECRIAITNDGAGTRALDPMEGFEHAIKSTEKERPPHLVSLTQAITYNKKKMKELSYEEDRYHIAFLSNKAFSNGAVSIFYKEAKDLLSRYFPDGCFVLPSSIHEMILLSKPHYLYRLDEVKSLPRMFGSTNRFPQDEILTGKVMEYHPQDGALSYAGEEKRIMMRRPPNWNRVLAQDPR